MGDRYNLRDWLDSWRLAAACTIALSIFLGLWSIKLTADTRHLAESNRELAVKVALETAKRRESERAANQNQVKTCFERNAQGRGIAAFLEAIKPVASGDPNASAAINNYIALLAENVPTKRACVKLAHELGVAVPKANS